MDFIVCIIIIGLIAYHIKKYLDERDQLRDYINAHSRQINNNVNNHVVQSQRPNNVRQANRDTGPMIYLANDPSNLPDNEYRFSFMRVDAGWRAYILKSPNINGRSATCHRLNDARGPYICWDRDIRSLKEMQTVARRWADMNQRYIATGLTF